VDAVAVQHDGVAVGFQTASIPESIGTTSPLVSRDACGET
jgi:hypothetical protein